MQIPELLRNLLYTGPYLDNTNRLADILAAIQVMGTYEYASRTEEKWLKRLGRKPKSAIAWGNVFVEHSEFFTIDDEKNVSLVWRRNFSRDYNVTTKKVLDADMVEEIKQREAKNISPTVLSRKPLEQSQIEHLCNLAINLHEREIQHRQEMRWWITAIVAIVVAVISLFN